MSFSFIRDTCSGFYSRASGVAQTAYIRSKRFVQSALGRLALEGIKENVLEFAGFYLGSYAGSEIGRRISPYLGSRITKLIPFIGGGCAYRMTETICRKFNRSSLLSIAGGIASLAAFHFALPSDPEAMVQSGEALIDLSCSWMLGILAAYVAIKMNGSSESLIEGDFYETYPVKTIFSSVCVSVLDEASFLPNNALVRMPVELALGSVFYNLLDLANLTSSLYKGKILDGYLCPYVPSIELDSSRVVSRASSYVIGGPNFLLFLKVVSCHT